MVPSPRHSLGFSFLSASTTIRFEARVSGVPEREPQIPLTRIPGIRKHGLQLTGCSPPPSGTSGAEDMMGLPEENLAAGEAAKTGERHLPAGRGCPHRSERNRLLIPYRRWACGPPDRTDDIGPDRRTGAPRRKGEESRPRGEISVKGGGGMDEGNPLSSFCIQSSGADPQESDRAPRRSPSRNRMHAYPRGTRHRTMAQCSLPGDVKTVFHFPGPTSYPSPVPTAPPEGDPINGVLSLIHQFPEFEEEP